MENRTTIELESLVGEHILSGIETGQRTWLNCFGSEEDTEYIKFTLDDKTYLAIENPDDGYRSYMEDLEIVDEECEVKIPNIRVCCHMRDSNRYEKHDVLVFVDIANGKEILAVGTGNFDDYYPYCVFEYTPENMSCNQNKKEG